MKTRALLTSTGVALALSAVIFAESETNSEALSEAPSKRSPDSGIELPLPEMPPTGTQKSGYKGKAKWTMYYVADVKVPAKKGDGSGTTVELLDGSKVKYWWTASDMKKMEMEATASVVTEDGEVTTITRIGRGQWQALPAEHYAKGNRDNMLYPWVHLAADQSLYRYGTRVYCELAVGKVTPDGRVHDGYYWIADTGGRIKGPLRFDLFVGRSNMYMDMMNRDRHPAPEVVMDRLPDAPKGMDPKTRSGAREILEGLGYKLADPKPPHATGDEANQPLTVEEALTDFQELHRSIPPVEYGNTRGAVTLWYLTQAALTVQKAEADAKKDDSEPQ